MSESTFFSLNSVENIDQIKILYDPDSEIDISDYIEGSSDMGNSGDGPCVDRSFVSRYLYRCLGDFMQEAYQAKIYGRSANKRKMCTLFESGFKCFEDKVEKDFGIDCTPHDMYNTAQWFKEEIYGDFSIDIRGCAYPERPPSTMPQTTSPSAEGYYPSPESPKTALVAGLVLGGAVLFICSMLVFVICRRRFSCKDKNEQRKPAKTAPQRGSVTLSATSGGGIGNDKIQANLQQQCAINIADTRSTLTGLSSDCSGHINPLGYDNQYLRSQQHLHQQQQYQQQQQYHQQQYQQQQHQQQNQPQEAHIYSEIKDGSIGMESQRVAPVGCSTIIAPGVSPLQTFLNSQETVPMTVDYVQSGGYVTHAHSAGYGHYLTPHQSPKDV